MIMLLYLYVHVIGTTWHIIGIVCTRHNMILRYMLYLYGNGGLSPRLYNVYTCVYIYITVCVYIYIYIC